MMQAGVLGLWPGNGVLVIAVGVPKLLGPEAPNKGSVLASKHLRQSLIHAYSLSAHTVPVPSRTLLRSHVHPRVTLNWCQPMTGEQLTSVHLHTQVSPPCSVPVSLLAKYYALSCCERCVNISVG